MSGNEPKLLIDVGSTYFKVATATSIEQHFRDFNKSILDDLMSKCGETIRRLTSKTYIFVRQPTVA